MNRGKTYIYDKIELIRLKKLFNETLNDLNCSPPKFLKGLLFEVFRRGYNIVRINNENIKELIISNIQLQIFITFIKNSLQKDDLLVEMLIKIVEEYIKHGVSCNCSLCIIVTSVFCKDILNNENTRG